MLGSVPLVQAIYGCLALALVAWLLSLATRDYSWVDRLWSIVPPAYVIWAASRTSFADPRLRTMALLTTVWGVRLTYNFARKGGYAPGGEDYRWAELKKRMAPWQFQIFNLVFVAVAQNVLLLLIASPAYVALESPVPLGPLDFAAAAAFVVLLVGETVADQEQWRFQREKKRKLARGEPITKPFLDTGLFRYSRHPNFFCEQAMWCVFYLFGVAASGRWLYGSIAGPVLLIALFQGSTTFTEELSLRKYPGYADYQKRVSRLIPLPPRW